MTTEKINFTLDIEKTTTQRILDIKQSTLKPAGFSKFKAGDRIHFVIKKPKKDDEKRASAIRVLIIPKEYFTKAATTEGL